MKVGKIMLVLGLLVFHMNLLEYSEASSGGDWGKRFKMGNPCSAAAQMIPSASSNLGPCPKAILAKLKLSGPNLAMGQIKNTTVNGTQESLGPKKNELGSNFESNTKEDPIQGNARNEFSTERLGIRNSSVLARMC